MTSDVTAGVEGEGQQAVISRQTERKSEPVEKFQDRTLDVTALCETGRHRCVT